MIDIKMGDKLYVITRRDLTLGQQAVQGMHAMREFATEHPEIDKAWHSISNFIAFLTVDNEDDLERLCDRTCSAQVEFSTFREPDLNDSLTAVCISPKGVKLCKGLKLALG